MDKVHTAMLHQCDECGMIYAQFVSNGRANISHEDYGVICGAQDLRETEQEILRKVYEEALK